MSWEPWFRPVVTNPVDDERPDPDDPRLLVNVFKDHPDDGGAEAIRQWAMSDDGHGNSDSGPPSSS
jgi:hypothetical protein